MKEFVKYFLSPTEFIVSEKPAQITTLLGSCVSVILWDTATSIGGMNHYMLPKVSDKTETTPKYGDVAIRALITKMLSLGCRRETLKAKIIGGAAGTAISANYYEIGKRNAEIALQILTEERIAVIAKDIGGARGRKVIFYTDTGLVYMKYLKYHGTEIESLTDKDHL